MKDKMKNSIVPGIMASLIGAALASVLIEGRRPAVFSKFSDEDRDRLEEQFSVSKGTLAGIEEKIGRRLRDLKEAKAVLKGHQYGRGIVG